MSGKNCIKFTYNDKKIKLYVNSKNCHVSSVISKSKSFYEEKFLSLLSLICRPGRLVLDVGAHIGNHTVFFAKVCGSRVVAIEPYPQSFAMLLRNIEANNLQENVTAIRVALMAEEATGHLVPGHAGDVGTNTLLINGETDANGHEPSVQVMTIDMLAESIDFTALSLIKIDVEGNEASVVRGGMQTITKHRPVLTTECLSPQMFYNLQEMLEGHGYFAASVINPTSTIIWVPEGAEVISSAAIRQLQDAGILHAVELSKRINNDVIKMRNQVTELQEKITRKDEVIAELQEKVAKKDEVIAALQAKITRQDEGTTPDK